MGRALYCPQGSKASQNLCPMCLKYYIFISLALGGGGVESVKSPALSLCFAGKGSQMWFLFETRHNWWQMQNKAVYSCNEDGGVIMEGTTVIGWL